jgi:hypothetical protein
MKLADCFTRDNPRKVISLKDEHRDSWLRDAIYEAHGGLLPDDWVYEECYAACEAIDDEVLVPGTDCIHEYADGRVDVYTSVLFHWAADHCTSAVFANAEAEAADYGVAEAADTNNRLGLIQYCAIARIAQTMLDAYEENGGGANEETEEEAVT